ncbi:DEAD/DEAH box helicase [Actinoplanes sp. ATCC 53533]|uniref:DEAD/DEAH box helicase n=1 Tax=Actinoplanes sp. ATCC 53533 TaxID=1288362 RepID=UPI0018F761B2|nr:DEAD/DEAH box helicase [Actinoplanes sp. ATCC 53533]
MLTPHHEETVTVAGQQVIVGPPQDTCGADLESGVSVRVIAAGGWTSAPTPPPPPVAVSDRALHWVKLTDPTSWRGAPAGTDVRIILPDSERTVTLQERLRISGVPFRALRYWAEDETVTTNQHLELSANPRPCALTDRFSTDVAALVGPSAAAARDAFDMIWQATAPLPSEPPVHVPTGDLVPPPWVSLLSHPTFNPAQAQVVPRLLAHDRHVLVVAPTGAGKTEIGMVAALQTVLGQQRKAAWLVPQRSLTDELDTELARWREAGLRVERLSGEYAVDVQRVRDADVWVATTEKFEALCRAGSVRQALAEVGCLVVDEIHLLGDASRGPVLEALLARVRGEASGVRIVGLSATVANAEDIAGWLGAEMVRVAWRPTRLTWQLPMITATSDWKAASATRARLAAALTRQVSTDRGSVLVFCGSKHNVRATALAIAADRGARIDGIDPADLDRVHQVCEQVGIGLHYKDWPHKRDAERRFRARDLDVLVATTTVAAGVNLPARAVVVRDTQVGLDDISVATVQQMFGRAGRVGAGETEGDAFLICDETERPAWQQRLVDGYTVLSQILATLPDHLLAEAVQGRISTLREAEAWWEQTLAFHQGDRSSEVIADAVTFLVAGGYLTSSEHPSGDADLTPTELGSLTARLMVPTFTGVELREALADQPVPTDPEQAEEQLLDLLAVTIPELAEAPIAEELRPAVARVLQAAGRLDRLGTTRAYVRGGLGSQAPFSPGDLAKAALKLCAHNPTAMRRPGRAVAGIPTAAMYPIWELAPRYLGWLAGQGYLASIHPWIAVVAADLSRRIRWRAASPPRGAGRLLWMCEQMATPLFASADTPVLFATARKRGVGNPDWTTSARPSGCRLDPADYTTLLRDRATGTSVDPFASGAKVTAPPGAVITTWTGTNHAAQRSTGDPLEIPYPDVDTNGHASGIAIFTRRGDMLANGWLEPYQYCAV